MNNLLSYDSETGVIVWKVSRGTARAGSVAGNLDSKGYIVIKISGKTYKAHRLAWFLYHEKWPKDQLDHINEIKTDNRIFNLREATHSNNNHNRGKYATNTSGYKGVSNQAGRWRAVCKVNGKRHHLGYYSTKELAYAAYCNFAAEHHEEFFHA